MEQPILMLQTQAQNPLISFAPILIVGVIFYLLIFMPMRKRQKETAAMIAKVENGNKVITSSGIYGTVVGVKEKSLILKVAEGKIEVAKSAIASREGPEDTQ
jgi:preprotein translocase subunit YajC